MKSKITYIRIGNYNISNLINTANVGASELSRYGKIILNYLKKYKH